MPPKGSFFQLLARAAMASGARALGESAARASPFAQGRSLHRDGLKLAPPRPGRGARAPRHPSGSCRHRFADNSALAGSVPPPLAPHRLSPHTPATWPHPAPARSRAPRAPHAIASVADVSARRRQLPDG